VLEKVELTNFTLTYTERDQQQHIFKLSYLELDENDEQSPIEIRAAGMIDARPIKLGGTLGSLAKLRDVRYDSDQTFPINFRLSSGPVDDKSALTEESILIVDGSIGSSSSDGSLVELILDIDLSELIGFFNQSESPNKLGHLQGTLSLTEAGGSWRFNKIKLVSSNTPLYQLKIDGVVDRLAKNPDVELQAELTVPSPKALGERLGIDLSGYAPYAGTGLLTGNKNQLNYQGHTTIGRIESEVILAVS